MSKVLQLISFFSFISNNFLEGHIVNKKGEIIATVFLEFLEVGGIPKKHVDVQGIFTENTSETKTDEDPTQHQEDEKKEKDKDKEKEGERKSVSLSLGALKRRVDQQSSGGGLQGISGPLSPRFSLSTTGTLSPRVCFISEVLFNSLIRRLAKE